MKQLITLLVMIFSLLGVNAQNPMFLGFDYQYEGVQTRLQDDGRVRMVSEERNRNIVIEYNQATITYHFNQGHLYQIDMCKLYSTKKEGKEAFNGCLRYFQMIATNEVAFASGPGKRCKISEKSGKLYNLELIPMDPELGDGYQLRLTSRDPKLTPMAKREADDAAMAMDEKQAMHQLMVGFKESNIRFL